MTDDAIIAALALHESGDWQGAERGYLDILRSGPNHAKASYNLGVLYTQRGQPDRALPYFEAALNADPARGQYWLGYIDALHLAGQADSAREILAFARQQGLEGAEVDALDELLRRDHANAAERDGLAALLNGGRLSETESLARALTQRFPADAFGWKSLGVVLKQLGRGDEAIVSMERAVALAPNDAEAPASLGFALHEQGRVREAEASFRRALEIDSPDLALTYRDIGTTLDAQNRIRQTEANARQTLEVEPDNPKAHHDLGVALYGQGRMEDAEASLRQALRLRPDYAEAHNNLGLVLKETARAQEAEASFRRALEIAPDFSAVHGNLGLALQDTGRLREAITSLLRALEIEPDNPLSRHNLSHALLMDGQLAAAWPEHESRWEGNTRARPDTVLPQWRGEAPQTGDRLLVIKEQGLGDQLQFCRYLTLAAERFPAGVSYVTVPSLAALLRRSFPGIEILDTLPDDQSRWQWQCPLMSLPLAFDTTLENLPAQVPYLIPDPAQVARWKSRMDALDLPDGARKIGLVWKPGKSMKNAPQRSLTMAQLAPLFGLPGCAWFSLQKEPDADKTPHIESGRLIDWSDELHSFDDTAALVAALDLVISVDTSVVHLAGALACPVWLLNRYASEWRWMRDREDSPWYPTMRIFTQKTAGDWSEVVRRIEGALG